MGRTRSKINSVRQNIKTSSVFDRESKILDASRTIGRRRVAIYNARRSLPRPNTTTLAVRPGLSYVQPARKLQARVNRLARKESITATAPALPDTVCVQRKKRREVLHATNRVGRGARRFPKYTWRSLIKCR